MRTRALVVALSVLAATTAAAAPAMLKWPPWISVESPVNPYDPAMRGVAMLVHVAYREGIAKLGDVSGTAEGIVEGRRRTVPLRFDATAQPGTFALRSQWPTDGTWLVRISVANTTAIVTLDAAGRVASIQVPTRLSSGLQLPRPISPAEIDSTLAVAARR